MLYTRVNLVTSHSHAKSTSAIRTCVSRVQPNARYAQILRNFIPENMLHFNFLLKFRNLWMILQKLCKEISLPPPPSKVPEFFIQVWVLVTSVFVYKSVYFKMYPAQKLWSRNLEWVEKIWQEKRELLAPSSPVISVLLSGLAIT